MMDTWTKMTAVLYCEIALTKISLTFLLADSGIKVNFEEVKFLMAV